MTKSTTRRSSGSLIFGTVLVILGVVVLLDNLRIIDGDEVLRYWPAILLVFGAVQVAQREDTGGKVFGMIVGIVGLWLLLNTLDVVSISLFSLWPLLLIGLGILLLVRASGQPPAPATEGGDVIAAFALMGGTRRVSASRDFRGGKFTAIMGGCEIDLLHAEIKGDSAVLDIFALAGGINVRVPSGWVVENRVTPILGGVEDASSPSNPDGKKLILIGSVVMGGVELKN